MHHEPLRKKVKVSPTVPHGVNSPPFHQITSFPISENGIYEGREIDVTYTNTPSIADSFLEKYASSDFGFDVEHKPTFRPGQRANLALLQLAPSCSSSSPVLVFSVYHNGGVIPDSVEKVLRDTDIKKYGVGMRGDLQHLAYMNLSQDSYRTFIDLGQFANSHDESIMKGIGLKALIERTLGPGLTSYKTKHTTMTNWEIQDLSRSQIRYAALDAYFGIEVFTHITQRQSSLDHSS